MVLRCAVGVTRRPATYLSLLLLALFAAGYIARYIPPESAWWLQLLGILLPFTGLALVLFGLLLALLRSRRLLAATGVALFLLALRYAPSGCGGDIPDRETLKVITYNTDGGIHHLAGGDRGLRELVRSEAPEVLCLQEFTAIPHGEAPFGRPHAPLATFFDSLGYRVLAPMRPGAGGMRQPIATRLNVTRAADLAIETEVMEEMENGAIRAEMEWRGRRFAVYNVHLLSYAIGFPSEEGDMRSPRTWLSYLGRLRGAILQRAGEARALRARLKSETMPFVVCGDLNSTVNQWTYHEIAHGLTDAQRAAGGPGGATFPARRPLFRIDYVLASPGWDVVSARVGPRLVSDHRAVVAELRPDF